MFVLSIITDGSFDQYGVGKGERCESFTEGDLKTAAAKWIARRWRYFQLQAEMKLLPDDQRKELLGQIGLPVIIPTDHALAIKADLALP